MRVDKRSSGILLSDYAGHAFTYELACQLHSSGNDVSYAYCSSLVSPKGRLDGEVLVDGASAGRRFERYSLVGRLMSEMRYGLSTTRIVWRRKPSVHVVCNMPLVSMLVFWLATLPLRVKLVVWFQDSQSGIAAGVLRGPVPRLLAMLEGFLLRRAARVIAISEELAAEARRQGVRADRLGVLENWAPIGEIPVRPKDNSWSRAHGLVDHPVLLYSGTLARKHRPDLLVDLARAVSPEGATVVVVSEGEGADSLTEAKCRATDLGNLVVLPYQPFEDLPDVLASADALIVLLEPHAAPFSVPSKTLSYLCAGRPIVASMPADNTAARIIVERAQCGLVSAPGDDEGFIRSAVRLLSDPVLRDSLGRSGRKYAEEHFDPSAVQQRFLREINALS